MFLLLLLVLPNYFLKNGKCDLFLIGENFFKNAFIVGVHPFWFVVWRMESRRRSSLTSV